MNWTKTQFPIFSCIRYNNILILANLHHTIFYIIHSKKWSRINTEIKVFVFETLEKSLFFIFKFSINLRLPIVWLDCAQLKMPFNGTFKRIKTCPNILDKCVLQSARKYANSKHESWCFMPYETRNTWFCLALILSLKRMIFEFSFDFLIIFTWKEMEPSEK